MKPCKHCCSSGNSVQYTGIPSNLTYTNGYTHNHAIAPCKHCQGTGWIDENKLITVPRKFVKDEYFET